MDWTRQLAAVAAGGAVGAMARFALSHAVQTMFGRGFPWGTLTVNLLGSLMLGLLYGLLVERLAVGDGLRALALVGFLGALTTFSTFAMDTVILLQRDELVRAMLYVIASVLPCIAFAWAGLALARHL
jgi:CrcB protein